MPKGFAKNASSEQAFRLEASRKNFDLSCPVAPVTAMAVATDLHRTFPALEEEDAFLFSERIRGELRSEYFGNFHGDFQSDFHNDFHGDFHHDFHGEDRL